MSIAKRALAVLVLLAIVLIAGAAGFVYLEPEKAPAWQGAGPPHTMPS